MSRAGRRALSPIGAVARGAVAGAAGTLAMDLVQYARYRRQGGDQPFATWEFSGLEGFEQAPAPAEVGRRLYAALFGRELGDERANAVNTVMHLGYGVAWGALYGLLAGSVGGPGLVRGPLYGLAIFADDYAVLPRMGLYQSIGHYDAKTLATDAADHAVYGSATWLAFELLAAPARLRATRWSERAGSRRAGRPPNH